MVDRPTSGRFNELKGGTVPASGGGTDNFLRADGCWCPPPSGEGGAAGVASFNGRTGAVALAGADVVAALEFMPQPAGDYASAFHGHLIADVAGLQLALDNKQPAGSYSLTSHNHDGAYAPASHVGTGGNAHANVVAGGAAGFISGSDKTKLDGIATGATANSADATLLARASHTGTQSLDTTIDSATRLALTSAERTKLSGIATAATANATDAQLRDRSTHTGTQTAATISDFAEAVDDRVASLVSPAGNLTENYDDAGNLLTLTATSGGGADPWTYIKLASDFVTSSATAVDVTGLGFTPSASQTYEFEAHLLCRTATSTVGPRPGIAWSTGLTDGVASIYTPSSATAEVQQHGNASAAVLAPVGGLPNATQSYGAKIMGTLIAGVSPAGQTRIQLASETAGTNVTIKAGSWLKFRTI